MENKQFIDPFDNAPKLPKRTAFEKKSGFVDPFDNAAEKTVQTPQNNNELQPSPKEVALSPEGVLGAQPEESRAVQELPELGAGGFQLFDGEDPETRSKAKLATMFTTDPKELSDILSSLSSDIGITQTPEGDLIANNNKTGEQVVVNKPGLSVLDIIQGLGITTAFTPAASVAQIPKKAAVRVAVGAGSSGLTETAIQELQKQLGGELNADEIAIATGLGGFAELVVPAIQTFRQGRQAKKVGAAGSEIESVAKNINAAEEASNATGVRLFQAQKTTIPAQLEKQSFVGHLPAGTQKASEQLRAQNIEASNAVDEFLNLIAPADSVVTGAEKFRTAAQNAVTKQVLIRREKASPLYKEAFSDGAIIDTNKVNKLITSKLEDAAPSGEVEKSLNRVRALITGKNEKPASLKQLHNAKLEIDQMMNKVGDNSLGSTTKGELKDVQNLLLESMDEGSDLYKSARDTFAKNSPQVDKIKDSIVGKLSEVDDTQLKSIARRIFDPAETNPQVIKDAKRVITDIDPDAWNQILRTELERRIGSVRSTLEAGTTENVPGQLFSAIFGNSKQRKVLFNAVDGQTRANLKYLETVLSRARLGRPGGSQTATREEIKRELKGGAAAAIRDFFKKPVSTLASAGEDAGFNRRVKALSDAMFNPEWKAETKKLRKLGTNSPAAFRAMTQLLKNIESTQTKKEDRENSLQEAQKQAQKE